MPDLSVTKRMTTEELEAFSSTAPAAIVDLPPERRELKVPARFQILSEIGRGGMGIVYKARDLETGEIVALKVLKPEIACDETMRESLRREVCLARKVTHKNVCRIHEFYRTDSGACVSMEFIDGESLLTKVHRVGALPLSECVDIGRQICAGLREAHAFGIVHRDLKPGNIMLASNGVVKIMDFGIARQSQEKDQFTRTVSGTPEYMAPEQIELKAIGPRTDVYALGLLLYEMFTGTQAFTGDTSISVILKQVRELPPSPSQIVPGIPSRVDALVLKCLRKNPESRFGSVEELDFALAQLVAGPTKSRALKAELARILGPTGAAFVGKSAREILRFAVLAAEIVRSKYQQFSRWMRARDSRKWFNALPAQVAIALGVIFMVCVTVFLLRNKEHGSATAEIVAPAPAVAAQDSMPPATPVPAPSTIDLANPFSGGVEFADDAGMPTASDTLSEASDDAATADDDVVDLEPAPAPAEPTRLKRSAKVQTRPAAKTIAPAKSVVVPASLTVSGPTPAPVTIAAQTTSPGPSASAGNSATNPVVAGTQTNTDDTADLAETYLEVGSFKDAKWADDAVNQLAQLGFHAISVHRGALWLQAYHVQVGPYVSSMKMAADQKKLEDQGFKPRAVK